MFSCCSFDRVCRLHKAAVLPGTAVLPGSTAAVCVQCGWPMEADLIPMWEYHLRSLMVFCSAWCLLNRDPQLL
eukprot:360335-Chlamydomonas_euryale.AAC.2